MRDLAHQTNPEPYPADVQTFADGLESVMADGTHDLPGIVVALNARKIGAGGHSSWTPASLSAYLAELANA